MTSSISVLALRQCKLDEHEAIRREPHVDGLQMENTTRQQPCSRHDGNGQGDLSYDECPPCVSGCGACHSTSASSEL